MNQLKPCRDLQNYELKQRRQKEKDLAAAGLSNNPEERRKTVKFSLRATRSHESINNEKITKTLQNRKLQAWNSSSRFSCVYSNQKIRFWRSYAITETSKKFPSWTIKVH
jgi:hypothetical protein